MGSLAGESSAKKSPQIRLRVLTGSHALRVSRFGTEQEPTTCAWSPTAMRRRPQVSRVPGI